MLDTVSNDDMMQVDKDGRDYNTNQRQDSLGDLNSPSSMKFNSIKVNQNIGSNLTSVTQAVEDTLVTNSRFSVKDIGQLELSDFLSEANITFKTSNTLNYI